MKSHTTKKHKRKAVIRVETVHTPSGKTPKSTVSLTATPSPRSSRANTLKVPPLRRQPAQGYRTKSAPRSPIFHPRAAHDYEIIMYDNIIKDYKKQAEHPTPVELLKALGQPQKYMHVFITRRLTKERLHIFQVFKGNYVVSMYKNDNLIDHLDNIDPVRVAREFISGALII